MCQQTLTLNCWHWLIECSNSVFLQIFVDNVLLSSSFIWQWKTELNIYSTAEGFLLAVIKEHLIDSTHADGVTVNSFLSVEVSSSLFYICLFCFFGLTGCPSGISYGAVVGTVTSCAHLQSILFKSFTKCTKMHKHAAEHAFGKGCRLSLVVGNKGMQEAFLRD